MVLGLIQHGFSYVLMSVETNKKTLGYGKTCHSFPLQNNSMKEAIPPPPTLLPRESFLLQHSLVTTTTPDFFRISACSPTQRYCVGRLVNVQRASCRPPSTFLLTPEAWLQSHNTPTHFPVNVFKVCIIERVH
uniref:Uncharacterized protein n=1 Tax=Sphaerodactylus townsendi TaxID=933632 RepID=A0ACB8G3B5_9SAUR